ncbi:MAG: 23S rRNA (guanosine(2251)-2'-O)-methyltransferase RlmB [Bacteroidia bacterium]
MQETNHIFGIHAVIEAIKAGKEIEKILIQRGLTGTLFNELRKVLQGKAIPYQMVPPEKINRITKKNHQGVIAFVCEIEYFKAEDILHKTFSEGRTPLVLLLDKITDVRNFGAIARSAECAGVDMIIIPQRGAAQLNADAIKTSAGALHRMPVCREYNLKDTIIFLKESGLQVIACHEKTEKLIYDVDFKIPTVIIMGSEDLGISAEYLKLCDDAVKIPMKGKIASLNVSVATGIVLFEVIRQRL